MKISIEKAKELIRKTLGKHGYDDHEIEKISEVIFYATLRNSSQGFPKLFGWRIERDKNAEKPVFQKINETMGRYDAKRNNGMYVCNLATDELIDIVKQNGNGIIGIYNNNNSSGAIGYYTKKLAQNGFVGIMFSSADPGTSLPNSNFAVFGTNPLAISVPYKNHDITLDMSTSKYTWGDLVDKSINGEKLEPGFAFDNDGNMTTDPKEAMSGTVTSFDGSYKGLGLAMMIQVLAGGLVGSVYAQDYNYCDYGHLIMAIDPEKFGGKKFMDEQVTKIITAYKSGKKDIYLPGEKGDLSTKENLKNNSVNISEDLLDKIENFIK